MNQLDMMDAIAIAISLVLGFVFFVGLIVLHVKLFFPFYTEKEMEERNIR